MMGRRTERNHLTTKSHTLPSSPTYSSSSSSDFEFTISLSPRKSSPALCPADELFYKGQLLPLHLSPRLSMVRTLLLASSSTSSSSDTTTTASRDSHSSTESHSSTSSDLLPLHHIPDCDSSRPSSATDDEFKRLTTTIPSLNYPKKSSKYFSLSRFSSVFRKEPKNTSSSSTTPSSSAKRVSSTAKEVIRKYLKKVKPLYEKLSQKHQQKIPSKSDGSIEKTSQISAHENPRKENTNATISHSFSGNLRYPRRRNCTVSSCPSSMRSSPSHSGIISKNGFTVQPMNRTREAMYGYSDSSSSMEELQNAIQGAIAHCKSSMDKTTVSNEI